MSATRAVEDQEGIAGVWSLIECFARWRRWSVPNVGDEGVRRRRVESKSVVRFGSGTGIRCDDEDAEPNH